MSDLDTLQLLKKKKLMEIVPTGLLVLITVCKLCSTNGQIHMKWPLLSEKGHLECKEGGEPFSSTNMPSVESRCSNMHFFSESFHLSWILTDFFIKG